MASQKMLILAALIAVTVVAGCVSQQTQSQNTNQNTNGYTVANSSNQALNTFLTDGRGMTLYYFTQDTAGAQPVSACSGQCLVAWPVFYASTFTVPSGLNSADFSSFTRADGAQQTAYKGRPLYYYYTDKVAGDVTGQGVGGVWFVVAP